MMLFAAPALADELPSFDQQATQNKDEPVLGVGVICDTSDQAQQFVSLRAAGQDLRPAMTKVNSAAQQARACGMAAVAFRPGETVGSRQVNGKLVNIVRITVIAGFDGKGWHPVTDTVQYAIIGAKGFEV
jgi:hypothetical protein